MRKSYEGDTMPRVRIGFENTPRKLDGKLVDQLTDELKSNREAGQPFIYEQTFATGRVKILVVWDDWKDLPLEDRTNIILAAVERSDGKEYRAKVALASGLTVPEAATAGMLPYQIITARRSRDKVTSEQCREAMLAEGASTLFGPQSLQLRFPTEESANACVKRLIAKLPGSDEIWVVTRELSAQDFGQTEWATAGEPA
jgi:hypothetical protein